MCCPAFKKTPRTFAKKQRKVKKSEEKWRKVKKSEEKRRKTKKNEEKWRKMKKNEEKWRKMKKKKNFSDFSREDWFLQCIRLKHLNKQDLAGWNLKLYQRAAEIRVFSLKIMQKSREKWLFLGVNTWNSRFHWNSFKFYSARSRLFQYFNIINKMLDELSGI